MATYSVVYRTFDGNIKTLVVKARNENWAIHEAHQQLPGFFTTIIKAVRNAN